MSFAKQASLTVHHSDLSTRPLHLHRSLAARLLHSPSSSPLFRCQRRSPPPTLLATHQAAHFASVDAARQATCLLRNLPDITKI
nr:hypothetical protein CFP56_53534 [Quercus suber]